MEGDADTTPSTDMRGERENRGAGGKLRKPSARKPPTTPYARPAEHRRWLSKLFVDPACRLISTGATRFLPSFFSKPPSSSALPLTYVEDHDKRDKEVESNAFGADHDCSSNLEFPRTTELAGPSREEISKSTSNFDLHQQENADLPDKNGLAEIEQLLKGRHFTRDEVSRLMEIINSKAVEHPTLEQEQKNQSSAARGEAKGHVMSHDIQKASFEKNKEDKNGLWGVSTPFPQSVMEDKVGASPIEIARAYMGNISSRRTTSNDERSLLHDSELAIEPFVPKPSACWPGAVPQDQHCYSTPQSQRGRFGLHNFPRTPYSRSIFSKSKSKLSQYQSDKDKLLMPYSSPQLSQTSCGQVNSKRCALDDCYGSVGPIRRPRHKFVAQTPSRGSLSMNSSVASIVENTNASRAFLPAVRKNFEHGGASSSSQFQSVEKNKHSFEGVPTVHPQSTQLARTILEHINRKTPTPKDKSEEVKLVMSWNKIPSSDSPLIIPNGHDGLWPVKEFNSDKIVNPGNQTTDKESNDTDTISRVPGFHVCTSEGGDGGSVSKSLPEDVSKITSLLPHVQKTLPPSSSKPTLSNISIDKPVLNWKFPSDNSTGFSFQVSLHPEVLSEPPTPSIMPTFSGNSQQQTNDAVPKYAFGAAKSGPALLFSFPSTTTAATHNDALDIKFSFGSDKTRLSFGSIGKNTICY